MSQRGSTRRPAPPTRSPQTHRTPPPTTKPPPPPTRATTTRATTSRATTRTTSRLPSGIKTAASQPTGNQKKVRCNGEIEKMKVNLEMPSGILKGTLCDFFIFTLEQIIVLNKYSTYNKPIPKISDVKTLQNLCKMNFKK